MAGPPPSDRPRGPTPRDEADLLARARALEGARLADIAALLGEDDARATSGPGRPMADARATSGPGRPVADARGGLRTKGKAGELIERALGATGGSAAQVDFPALGVELKTVPVDAAGRPRESTFVCTLPLAGADRAVWATSWVRRKLGCVLWVPLVTGPHGGARERAADAESARAGNGRVRQASAAGFTAGTTFSHSPSPPLELGDDPSGPRVGRVVLWRPTPEQEAVLAADFDEIVGLIGAGAVDTLTARVGRWLQARPKAAHGRARTLAFGPEGERTSALPRGFYLRARFTGAILQDPAAVPE